MAREKKEKEVKQESLESVLWAAADKLRGGVAPQDYMHVVLGLVFLKYLSDRFEIRYQQLVDENLGYQDDPDAYEEENVFWIPERARWKFISRFTRQDTIGQIIDDAFREIEKFNTRLKNILPKTYSKLEIDKRLLGELIDLFTNKLNTTNFCGDFFGRVYEYFLGQFSKNLGQKGGEFYTPKCIVELLVEMIEPYPDENSSGIRVYDPCCGSGGMFVQSIKFVKEHQTKVCKKKNPFKESDRVSIYGQELNANTWRLANMNLAIRGIDADLGLSNGDTFHNDKHPTLRADYILANPPFNISDYGQKLLLNDPRWVYGIPPEGNANYAWVQHIYSKLSPTGVAGFILANGSLSTSSKQEYSIRKAMLEDGIVDAIVTLPTQLFSTVAIPVCAWFLRKNKANKGRTLFIDARQTGEMIDRKTRVLTDEEIHKIADTYHNWLKNENYEDIKGFCKSASIDEVREADYSLVPGRYVGIDNSNEMTPEQVEEEIKKIKLELKELFAKDKEFDAKIMEILNSED